MFSFVRHDLLVLLFCVAALCRYIEATRHIHMIHNDRDTHTQKTDSCLFTPPTPPALIIGVALYLDLGLSYGRLTQFDFTHT